MYIIEIIAKLIKNRLKKTINIDELYQESPEIAIDDQNCKHFYIAIDSTNEYLACNDCGHVIKNPQIKIQKNPFIK